MFILGGGPGDLRTPSLLMGLTWPLVIHPVPGLLEQRPSVLWGDKLYISRESSGGGGLVV